MVVRQDKFQACCINNKYQDFGNHTGFQYVESTFNHLVIGEWYSFEKSKYGMYDLIINDKIEIGTGYGFAIREGNEHVGAHIDFYAFFSTIQEARDMKLNEIIDGN